MSWGEAIRLTQALATDTSTMVGAALSGWGHPFGRDLMLLADLYDSHAAAHFEKPKPYPRPWVVAAPAAGTTRGDTGGRTPLEVVRYLNWLGHHLPEPDDDEGGEDG